MLLSPPNVLSVLLCCLAPCVAFSTQTASGQEPKTEKKDKKSEAAEGKKDSAKKKEPAQLLLGSWKMVEIHRNGNKSKPPIELMFTFKKGVVEQKVGPSTSTSKYKLDPKNPQHIDVIRERNGTTRTFKMLFKIEGKKLKMCSSRPDADRPKKFGDTDGFSIQLLERVSERKP